MKPYNPENHTRMVVGEGKKGVVVISQKIWSIVRIYQESQFEKSFRRQNNCEWDGKKYGSYLIRKNKNRQWDGITPVLTQFYRGKYDAICAKKPLENLMFHVANNLRKQYPNIELSVSFYSFEKYTKEEIQERIQLTKNDAWKCTTIDLYKSKSDPSAAFDEVYSMTNAEAVNS